MANVERVNGFKPIRHLTGAPYNGQTQEYVAETATLAVGDAVKLTGASSVDGKKEVGKATPGDVVVGVVTGLHFNMDDLAAKVSTVGGVVRVADAPDLIFEVQGDAALPVASFGLNADLIDAGVNTATGASGQEIDVSTAATTATLSWRIYGANSRVDNEINSADNKLEVMVNLHQYANGSTGV